MDESSKRDLPAEPSSGESVADRPLWVVVALLVATFLGGLVVVSVAGALETDGDCSTYGYGGYGCVDFTDAQLTVDPTDDLVDRQTVAVSGVDFDPHFGSFGIAQCVTALIEEHGQNACDISTSRLTYVDGSGRVNLTMTVRRIITTAAGGETDCADPNTCEISGGTYSDGFVGIEGVRIPTSFDPTVPPIPPLELELVVDEVTADSASGTVVCNREASLQLDGNVQQEKAGKTATSYGYLYDGLTCGADQQEWTMPLMPGNRRLTGGPAQFSLFAYAYDGFESVYVQESLDVNLQGGPRPTAPALVVDGTHTTIRIIDAVGSGADQAVVVELYCGRATEYASVNISVSQWAGLDRVYGYGYGQVDECDGTHQLELPILSSSRVLVGGPAQVDAQVSAHEHRPPDYFHDYASASDQVRLSGQVGGGDFDAVPDPDSRITIDTVTRSLISGTIECEEPVMVDIYGYGVSKQGRNLEQASGSEFIQCEGTTNFTIDLTRYDDGLRPGQAAVSVSAYAYRIVEMDDYDYYEYVWDDLQQVAVRVTGAPPPGQAMITPGGIGGPEGDDRSQFVPVPVRLADPAPSAVTVDWATVDNGNPGIATAGSDYAAASGTVTFAPGDTEQTVLIEVFGDTADEPGAYLGEWLPIAFTNPSSNADLDSSFFGLGLIIIGNDD